MDISDRYKIIYSENSLDELRIIKYLIYLNSKDNLITNRYIATIMNAIDDLKTFPYFNPIEYQNNVGLIIHSKRVKKYKIYFEIIEKDKCVFIHAIENIRANNNTIINKIVN